MNVEVIRSPALVGVPHGFLGRRGGVSLGVVAGLNVGLGSDDDPAHVAQNRARAVAAVAPGGALVTVYQVHSAEAVRVTEPFPDTQRPHADAMVTDRPGRVLGIVTADCAPVLLADADTGVIGAAHAGWKGARGGVVEAAVAAMARLGARRERIAAAIGPCIAQRSYEVDDDFRQRFAFDDRRFFIGGREGHSQFDLEAFLVAQLWRSGIERVDALGLDTYADAGRFFSYRRATHAGEPDYGRQFSLIALPATRTSG